MSDEKEKLRQKYACEEQEAQSGNHSLPDAPPAYEDIQGSQNPYSDNQYAPPPNGSQDNGYGQTPSGNYANYPPPHPQQPPQPPQPQQGSSSAQQQPQNLYTIKPTVVDINNTDPRNLNPQYQIFKQNQEAKVARGEYAAWDPKAPLEKGHTSNKKIDSSFPGRSGATYYNAANKH
ncbi:hypothetical protein CANMA_005325 [Candida margitis]|uniref:uncharacterized protein n=1 Tax=Candida margitis TaxID=1775924 RepID=UPI002226DAED|nr:uncharacterized protein CANMA_005325 [Candida margitis]KAI5950397.1 hypothetical protein CANMA_005325 [Candida margitis]